MANKEAVAAGSFVKEKAAATPPMPTGAAVMKGATTSQYRPSISLLDEDGAAVGTPLRLNPFAGNEGVLAGEDGELVQVSVLGTDPEWELLSGDDAGTRAFSVNLMVDGFEKRFIRQVIAGYPEFTEDLVQTDDPQQHRVPNLSLINI